MRRGIVSCLPVPMGYLTMNFVVVDILNQVTLLHMPGGMRQSGLQMGLLPMAYCQ